MARHVGCIIVFAVIEFILLTSCLTLNGDKVKYSTLSRSKRDDQDESCQVGLRIYHSKDATKWEDFCIEQSQDLFTSDYYDRTKCTVLIGLPFMNHVTRLSQKIVIEALVTRGNYNIMLLDNSKHTYVLPWNYNEAVLDSYHDSKVFATALNQAMDSGLLRSDCVVGVGYSLAANTMGHVCRQLNHPCQALYAIDPAGPGFIPPGPDVPPERQLVSHADACHVVFLMCTVARLGTKYHQGHVNILLNDGLHQPNCDSGAINMIPFFNHACSHSHCNKVFASGIANPGSCVATNCEILGKSHAKACADLTGYRLDLQPDRKYAKCGTRELDLFFLQTSTSDTCVQTT